jgi:hypothetical protein
MPYSDNRCPYTCLTVTTAVLIHASQWQPLSLYMPHSDNRCPYTCLTMTTAVLIHASQWQPLSLYMPYSDNRYCNQLPFLLQKKNPCRSFVLKKMIVSPLLQKFTEIYGNRKFLIVCTWAWRCPLLETKECTSQKLTYSSPHRLHAYRFTRTHPVSGLRGGSWMITNL